jgi:tetratricopeptide (TPR) repeat protein
MKVTCIRVGLVVEIPQIAWQQRCAERSEMKHLACLAASLSILSLESAYAQDAETCAYHDNVQVAIGACTRIIQEDGSPVASPSSIYFLRGNWYFMLPDYSRARKDFTEALRRSPDGQNTEWQPYQAYYHRGYANRQLGMWKEALDDYAAVIKLLPGFGHSYYQRGVVYEKMGKTAFAIKEYEKAALARHSSARALDALARLTFRAPKTGQKKK